MQYDKGRHPGAVWKKCDFQIHTPRDPMWRNGPHLPGGQPESAEEAARDAWADRFVEKCVELGLGAIAITDHHDFCFIPYIRRAIQRLSPEKRFWLFPGVEITCNDAVQCIVLFDCDSARTVWARLFGGHLQTIQETPSCSAELPQAAPCGKNIDDLVKSIQGDREIAEVAILLPHGGNEGAHKTVLRAQMHNRFKTLDVDGVYVEQAFSALSEVAKQKIYAKILQWGSRRRGILTTGDNRDATFADLARHPCWIRLGEPTVESIREALLADEARITYDKPAVPKQRILELNVNSSLTGREFSLSINDGFTALIGGRGSGKTALLEYLRFGLGRSTSDTKTEGAIGERERQLIASTLQDGSVTVILERDGLVETWTRSGNMPSQITVTVGGHNEEITIEAAQRRFRGRAYAQKQLSTLVVARENAAEQITGIAAAEHTEERRSLDLQIAGAQREITTALQNLVEYWVADSQHSETQGAVSDLNRRLQATQIRLRHSGLSEETQDILNRAPAFSAAESLFTESASNIADDISTLTKLRNSIPSIEESRWTQTAQVNEAGEYLDSVRQTRESVIAAFNTAVAELRLLEEIRVSKSAAFQPTLTHFQKIHAAAVAQQAQVSDLVSEATRLGEELRDTEGRLRQSAARLKQFAEAPANLDRARQQLDVLLEQKRDTLQAAAEAVSARTQLLNAKVESEELPEQYTAALASMCENQRVRDAQQRCEERVTSVVGGATGQWKALGDELLRIFKAKTQAGEVAVVPSAEVSGILQSQILFSLTQQQVNGVYKQLTPLHVARVLTSFRDDFVTFEYRDKSGLIPFTQASPGQQAAALLDLLLNQEAGTLIIDQPEDDLDNKIIMDIVRLVQQTKRKRQLVFATHNANFVVNGDADKVVALVPVTVTASQSSLTCPRVAIEVDGAIETPPVRAAITETVEGGREAFELRSRKYLFRTR